MSKLKLQATDGNGGTVSLKGPASTTGNAEFELTLPGSAGSNGQLLSTNGSGVLTWTDDANAPEGTAVKSTGVTGTTKYLRADGDNTCSWQTVTSVGGATGVDFNDSVKARWGTGNDLEIYHDGSHSYALNTTGNLVLGSNASVDITDGDFTEYHGRFIHDGAVELYYDNSKKFHTTSAGVFATGEVTATGHLIMTAADNQKIYLGAGNDLQIYHDGSHSYIKDAGTGNLQIVSNQTNIQDADLSNYQAKFIDGGAVELYHNGTKSFQTDSSGISVIGPEGGDGKIYLSADESDDIADKWQMVASTGGNFYLRNYASGSWETSIYSSGNGDVQLYYDNSLKLQTTSTGISVTGNATISGAINTSDNQNINVGNSGDLKIYHNGSNTFLTNTTGYMLIDTQGVGTSDLVLRAGNDVYLQPQNGESGVIAKGDGAVELYYDNSKKLETTSAGATVSGQLTVDGNLISYSANNNSLGLTGHRWNDLFIANDIDLLDNSILMLGTGNDLNLWHDGSNSNIENQTGQLRIRGSYIFLRSQDAQETFAQFTVNAASELFYDNSIKLATTSDGVEVKHTSGTAILKVTGYEGNAGAIWLTADDGDDYTDTCRLHQSTDGRLYIQNVTASNTWENMITAGGNGSVELYYDNSKKLETTSGGAHVWGNLDFMDNAKVRLGTNTDLQIYHDGTDSFINHNTGSGSLVLYCNSSNPLYLDSNLIQFRNQARNEYYFKASNNGAVEMYYDNSKKFETRSDGVDIHGLAEVNGNVRPNVNNSHDLGTSSLRWRNVYTNDLNLSNEGGDGNSVDGTTGDWTIQEGADNLFIVNNKNGKKFKFALQEVN